MKEKKQRFFKARRQMWLTVAFITLWVAFPLAYAGGTGGNGPLTAIACALVGLACLICILAGK